MTSKVYVVGVGMTKFEKPGRREGWDYPAMAKESGTNALNDAGLRYDLVTNIATLDQSKNPNFVAVQAAGAAGLLKGIVGLENFGKSPQDDRNNFQPRIGAVYDLRGDAKDIVRAGWGIYTDFGYTNSNVLFAATDSTGSVQEMSPMVRNRTIRVSIRSAAAGAIRSLAGKRMSPRTTTSRRCA